MYSNKQFPYIKQNLRDVGFHTSLHLTQEMKKLEKRQEKEESHGLTPLTALMWPQMWVKSF